MEPQKPQKLKGFLKSFDIYAKPIQLTYKGKEKFRSPCGGILSIMVILTILSAFIYNLRDLILRNQTQVKKNTLVSQSNAYSPPEVISERNITIAFMLSDFYAVAPYNDPYYGELQLTQFRVTIKTNETDGTMYREFESFNIPYSKCEIGKNVFYENKEEIIQLGIEKFYCADWTNLTIQGNWNAPVHARVQLVFQRCLNATCATDEEFNTWIKKITLEEIIISTYFDIDNYEEPIQYFSQDYWISLQPEKSVVNTIYFKKNNLDLNDNIFGLFITKTYDYFYQVSRQEYFLSDDFEGPGTGVYLYQLFKLDREYDSYERDVYTVVGVLKDVGGFYNSLFFGGLFLYSKFQGTLYFATLINKLYQVEQMDDKELLEESVNSTHNSSRQKLSLKKQKTKKFSGQHEQAKLLMATEVLKEKLTSSMQIGSETLDLLKDYLKYRWRLNFSFRESFKITLSRTFCCKKSKVNKEIIRNFKEKKEYVFERGQKKVLKDLDCINILSKLRLVDQLGTLLLNDHQKYLLNFSKKSLIREDYGLSSSDEEILENRTVIQTFPGDRNEIDDTLSKALRRITHQKFNSQNKKILFGLISKKPQKILHVHKESKTKEIKNLEQLSISSHLADQPSFKDFKILPYAASAANKKINKSNDPPHSSRKKVVDSDDEEQKISDNEKHPNQKDTNKKKTNKILNQNINLKIIGRTFQRDEIPDPKSSQRQLNESDKLEDFESYSKVHNLKAKNQNRASGIGGKKDKSNIFQSKTFDI